MTDGPTAHPVRLEVYRTAIPMRRFEHAAAARDVAEAVVVRLELSDRSVGWGETLPREYVTGETIDSVVRDLCETIWPARLGRSLAEGLPAPTVRPAGAAGPEGRGRLMNAAACAWDLARAGWLLDRAAALGPRVVGRLFGAEGPRRRIGARVSGVLGSADPARTARHLGLMRAFGLRDFKLKLGLGEAEDAENLRIVGRRIGRAVARGKCTLRVDVNGAWTAAEAPDRIAALAEHGVCVVEQPTDGTAAALADLAGRCRLPLMADESLLTEADAEALLAGPGRVWWNIRLSKNGGLARSLALARRAEGEGVPFVAGCMVGESGILSAAQRRFLQWGPRPRFVEGNYGRLLLADDLTRPSLRFGYGGRLRALRGRGLGVSVDPNRLAKYGQRVAVLEA